MGWRDDPIDDGSAPVMAETPAGAATGFANPRPDRRTSFEQAWMSDPPEDPPLSAKVGAVGQGATGGLLESLPLLAGALTGAKLGAPGGPWGMAAGTVIGGGAGALAGRSARNIAARVPLGDSTLTTPSAEDVRPELRPYARGGEAVGAGLPIVAAPFAAPGARLPEFQGARITPAVNRMLESAEKNPGAFFKNEIGALGSAGFAGGTAEHYRPGDTVTRVGAEIAGGAVNPSRYLFGAWDWTARQIAPRLKTVADSVRHFASGGQPSTFRSAASDTRAAQVLQDIVTQAGEDPAQLSRLLRQEAVPGMRMTAAQASGSPALMSLERKLAQESAKFGNESQRLAEDSLSQFKMTLYLLEGSGDPQALKEASRVREQYFRALITGRLQMAEARARSHASKIPLDTPEARSLLARDANTAVEEALRESRAVERELWGKVAREVPAAAENVIARFSQLQKEMLPEESIPYVMRGPVRRMAEGGAAQSAILGPDGKPIMNLAPTGKTTSGELMLFRSRALELAREAAAKGNFSRARFYGNMAEAALDDLDRIATQVPGLTEARQFSKELNDTFTRTFAGESLATKGTGADRIPPEVMLRRAFGTGKEAGALRLKQLEDATAFLKNKGIGGPEAADKFDFMLDAQQLFLRQAASGAIDPVTGRASAIRLSRFMADNAELMERFPEIKRTLQDAVKSETGLQNVERWASNAQRTIDRDAAFAKVLRYDSPADAVRAAVSSNTPAKDFIQLAKVARSGGRDAIDGLKAAAWQDAMRRASTESGELSFVRLQSVLFNPVRPGQPSLMQIMKGQGLMTEAEAQSASFAIKRAMRIEEALARGGRGGNWEHLVGNPDALQDLVIRISGAKLGGAIAGSVPGNAAQGHGLIAAAAGSSYLRKVLEKIPQGKVKDVLVEAALSPELMATLLTKPKTQAEGIRLARRLHAYLLQAGITGDDAEQLPQEPRR